MRRLLLPPIVLALVSCSSTPDAGRAAPATFHSRMAAVHDAALHALVQNGFEVQRDEPNYVEGFHPRQWGLVMGSGGETLGIWIESNGDGTSTVRVDTAKSFVGIVGQKGWNDDVLAAMRQELEKP